MPATVPTRTLLETPRGAQPPPSGPQSFDATGMGNGRKIAPDPGAPLAAGASAGIRSVTPGLFAAPEGSPDVVSVAGGAAVAEGSVWGEAEELSGAIVSVAAGGVAELAAGGAEEAGALLEDGAALALADVGGGFRSNAGSGIAFVGAVTTLAPF